jgi:hypothetical protein
MPTTVFYRDRVAGKFRPCAGNCGRLVLPPKRKCPHCKKQKKYTVTVEPPRNKGRNARGTCLHKPDKIRTKRAKKQRIPNMPLSNDTIRLIDAELKLKGSK